MTRPSTLMKPAILAFLAATFIATPPPAIAGPIGSACMNSPRPQKSAGLCRCIQNAADQTLTRREQRQAARFFRDPHRAQVVRQSSSAQDRTFWTRYRNFGATAEALCG